MRVIPLLLLAGALPAADWHVAPGGSDVAAGSVAAPLATLAGAIGRSASGDRILLARGGTFRQSAVVIPAGRTVDAYGTGELPLLTASIVVAPTGTWASNAAVSTAAVGAMVVACWIDGTFAPLARWPDSGWLFTDATTTSDAIIDAGLSARPGVAAGRWTGAQVRWRRWSWWFESRPISGQPSTTRLDLGAANKFADPNTGIGSGYFIDNDLDELDAAREWFWGGGTLYAYLPGGASTIEVATTTAGIACNGATLRNLRFARFAGTALSVNAPSLIEDCRFDEIEDTAIAGSWNAMGSTVRRCVFRDVRNTAIAWNENPAGAGGTVLERNAMVRIGMQPGYGGSGSWHAAAVVVTNAKALTLRLNQVVDVGYCGIILGSPGQRVERNVFVRCMSTLNDGAAIYANCDDSIVRENIVLDTIGDTSTSHPWWPLGQGIWMEFLNDFKNWDVSYNTVSGSNGNGIYMGDTYTSTIDGNVVIDSRTAGVRLDHEGVAQGHGMAGNTFAVVAPTRRLARTERLEFPGSVEAPSCVYSQSGVDYGAMSGTTAVSPTGSAVFKTSTGDHATAAAWAGANASWADAGARVVRAHALLLFNDTEATASVPVPAGTWTHPDGTPAGGSVPIAPFRSVVLVSASAPPATPPYIAASGRDWRAADPTGIASGPGGAASAGGGEEQCGMGSLGLGLIALALATCRRQRRRA